MDIKIRKGESVPLTLTSKDETAISVQFLASDSDDQIVINESASFSDVDGKRIAYLVLSSDDTDLDVGEYKYMYVITYPDDIVRKLPDVSNCEGDCTLPTLTICESIEVGVS